MSKPAWMVPIQYNDDRFDSAGTSQESQVFADDLDEKDSSDIEELLNRPDRKEDREYECNDVSPINYGKGEHNDEFGVSDNDWDDPDEYPIDYNNGPDDEEFGVEDDGD